MIVDSAEVVYAMLAAEPFASAITDSDGLHLYGPPGTPENFQIRKALVFFGGGGAGDPDIPKLQEDFSFYCYGNTAAEARLVYRHLYSFLHRFKHRRVVTTDGQVIVQYAMLVSGPQDRVEGTTEWPFVYCSFIIQMIETLY